jgi:hypothetical protein
VWYSWIAILIYLIKLPLQDLTSTPKYLVTFTVGYDQRMNIDACVKKVGPVWCFIYYLMVACMSMWTTLSLSHSFQRTLLSFYSIMMDELLNGMNLSGPRVLFTWVSGDRLNGEFYLKTEAHWLKFPFTILWGRIQFNSSLQSLFDPRL